MASSRTLSVVITGDAAGARRAFSETDTAAANTESKLSKVGGKLASLGKTATIALGAGVAAFSGFAISQALAGEQAHARLVNAMKNAGPEFTDLAKRADNVTEKFADWGFQNDDVEIGLSKLAPVTKNSKDAIDKLSLAANIAKARNISLEDATALLVKVQTGHVGLLGRLGINTKDATGATISQEDAIKRLSDMYGGQANRSAKTLSGQIAGLKAKFANFAEEVGQKVIPIVTSVIKWFTKHKTVAAVLAGIIGGALVVAVGAYTASMVSAAAATIAATWPILAVVAVVGALVAAAYFLWTNWDKVWGWIKNHPAIAAIIAILAWPIAAFVAIIGGLKLLYDNWDTIWGSIKVVLGIAWDFIRSIFDMFVSVGATIMSGIQWAWDNIGQHIFDAIGTAIGGVLWVVNTLLKPVWDGIFAGLQWAWDNVGKPALDAIMPVLNPIIGAFRELKSLFNDIAGGSWSPSDEVGRGGTTVEGASGGIVTRPTLAIIGEAGPEAVVPLNRTPGSSPLPMGGGGPLVIQLAVDGRVLTEAVVSGLNTPGGPKIRQRAIV